MADFNININANTVEQNNIAGEILTRGDLVYLADDQKYYKASAADLSKCTTELKIANDDAVADGTVPLLVYGYHDYDNGVLLTPGARYYVSTAPGEITLVQYTGDQNVIRYVGTAYSETILLFNPDQTYLSDEERQVNGVPLNYSHLHVEDDIVDLDKYTQQEVDDLLFVKQFYNTGLVQFGDIVVANPGVDSTFSINMGIGGVNVWDGIATNQPEVALVQFGPFNNIAPQFLATDPVSYIGITYDFGTQTASIVQKAEPFTNEERRSVIILGAVVHSNNTVINAVNNISAPLYNTTNQLHDLMEALGPLTLSGLNYSAAGANLTIGRSAGTLFKLGTNAFNNFLDPHRLTLPVDIPVTFRYRLSDSTEFADTTTINPNLYESAPGVTSAVGNNDWTIQRIVVFQSGITRIQYGQNTYATLEDAEIALDTQSFDFEDNIAENGIFRCFLIVQQGTTDLTALADAVPGPAAKFINVTKFGATVTASGGAVTAQNIIDALGYTPEDDGNKVNTITAPGSSVLYPTTKAVVDYVASVADSNYVHTQGSASTTWIINHNLGKLPSLRMKDGSGNNLVGQVTSETTTSMTVEFNVAVDGVAYLN